MKVLIVDAHPDDGEISAGGTIARLVREGNEVRTVYFCPCIEAKENVGHLEDHEKACKILGIKEIIKYNYPRDGYLETHKQKVRNELWKIRELYQPNLVLCPSPHDFHQDHRVISECCMTIFRDTSSIFGFEVMRSVTPDFKPMIYVTLELEDVQQKEHIILTYKSQRSGRPYFFTLDRFKAQMIFRGTEAKTDWAEAFELLWGRI